MTALSTASAVPTMSRAAGVVALSAVGTAAEARGSTAQQAARRAVRGIISARVMSADETKRKVCGNQERGERRSLASGNGEGGGTSLNA